MAYGDYSQSFGDLGDFISRLILAHKEKQKQDATLSNLLGASQQNVPTPAPVGLPLPAQPGSMNPPRVSVPQIPVTGVPGQSQEQTPLTDPRLQAAFMQMFKENPQMAQAWMGVHQATQPTYTQKEVPRGGTLITQKETPGQPPQQVGETRGQPVPSLRWTTRVDANGKPVTEQFGQTIRTIQDEIDNNTGQKTGNKRYAPGGTENQAGGDARLDRSYQFHTGQISALAKPIQDRSDRIERLRVSLNENSPQADALIAPELLTVMAGGQGSGLRMNEAEISRIVGGRNHWQDLKSAALKWQADPTKPFLITPEQRMQVISLVDEISKRTQEKLGAVNEAQSKMVNAPNVETHRKIFSDLRNKLSASEKQNNDPMGIR